MLSKLCILSKQTYMYIRTMKKTKIRGNTRNYRGEKKEKGKKKDNFTIEREQIYKGKR
jgi:hypothetical protein